MIETINKMIKFCKLVETLYLKGYIWYLDYEFECLIENRNNVDKFSIKAYKNREIKAIINNSIKKERS